MTTAHSPARLLSDATRPLPTIVDAAAGLPLDRPTPCTAWTTGDLVRHLLFWAPLLAAAGRRSEPVPVAVSETEMSLDGWPERLVTAHADVASAWSDPAAWTGTTTMGAPEPMPAQMIGGMVLGELVLHGWDLARAAGVEPVWSDEVLAATAQAVDAMAEMGRGMGIFADAVPLTDDAPLLDRIVAASGRDPR